MNRRGFLTGLGALLATSALVKPAAPVDTSPFWIVNSDGYTSDLLGEIKGYSYSSGHIYDGCIGRYLGIAFVENDELRIERIPASDLYE